MLQINTGKLFTRAIDRTNQLTGVLYSNLRLPYDRDIVTLAGRLRATGMGLADVALVYEIDERIELEEQGPEALVSHTVKPFLEDFSVVAAFGLGGVVGQSEASVRALTDARPGRSAHGSPSQYVSRVFDQSIFLSHQDAEDFEVFVTNLLALERRSYLGAMRAMRTFVAGLYRMPDDLAQAYTLIVSALESLAQDFDQFEPSWEDVEQTKRLAIDQALESTEETAAAAVRKTLLKHEHVAISRRYRAYALSHVDAAFFRQPTKSKRPIARHELEIALRSAYELRSASLHRGRALPDAVTIPHDHWETTTHDRRAVLTFEGLARVTRHVIQRFVANQPKVEKEIYNYLSERAGIVMMELGPQYWVASPLHDPAQARKRLEGLLNLACSALMREEDSGLVDMRPVLADIEQLLPQAPHKHRAAMLSLHLLFNFLVSEELRSPNFAAFFDKHGEEAGVLSIESLVVASLFNATDDWNIAEQAAMLDRYFVERHWPSGLHAPRLIEAAMCLTLAERHRAAGDDANARAAIALAVEAHPGRPELQQCENDFDMDKPVAWRVILLPPPEKGDMQDEPDEA